MYMRDKEEKDQSTSHQRFRNHGPHQHEHNVPDTTAHRLSRARLTLPKVEDQRGETSS